MGTPSTMNGIVLHTVGETWQAAVKTAAAPDASDVYPRLAAAMEKQ
jgi:hypothetical protein